MVRPAYHVEMPCEWKSCRIAPMLKMTDATTIVRRRPKRAVKGQAKKQEKKAGHGTELVHAGHFGTSIEACVPPAWSRLAERELMLVVLSPIEKSFWNDESVRTPPTIPVSYAKRNDPTQLKATRYEALNVPRSAIVAMIVFLSKTKLAEQRRGDVAACQTS